MTKHTSRRRFLSAAGAGAATFTILGGRADGVSPNEKLDLVNIGAGGQGGSDRGQFASHKAVNIVAMCDVDSSRLGSAAKKFPAAKTFTDFRKLFDTMGSSVDAVHVATPDHMHAPIAMTALNLGKHVYCQKPLTHEVFEARRLTEVAKEKKLVTQMGIQIHSHEVYRTAVKIIHDGVIGKVKEAHSWSHKTWGYPQGRPDKSDPVPANLDWDAWLGTAPDRPFVKGLYHPGSWRRWFDFGCGTMGDMSIHILDPVAKALALGYPTSVISESPPPFKESFGIKNRMHYTFPGTKYTVDPLKLSWYDGKFRPDTTDWPVKKIPGQGSMFIGEKGSMLLPHIGMPKLFPEKDFADFKITKVAGESHYHQWVNACLGQGKASANFDYSGPLTEFVLLGVLSNRVPGIKLEWDGQNMKVKNSREAQALVKRTYRKGWEVEGL